jgi:hypothetical protein
MFGKRLGAALATGVVVLAGCDPNPSGPSVPSVPSPGSAPAAPDVPQTKGPKGKAPVLRGSQPIGMSVPSTW